MTANAIADGDLSRRVAPAEEKTEVGRLGIALNTMLGQIEGAFEETAGVGGSAPSLRRGRVARAAHAAHVDPRLCGAVACGRDRDPGRAGRRHAPRRARGVAHGPARGRHAAARSARRGSTARPRSTSTWATSPEDAVRDARAVEPGRPITLGAGGRASSSLAMRIACARSPRTSWRTRSCTRLPARRSRCGSDDDGPAAVLEVADHGPGLTPELARQGVRAVRASRSRADARDGWLGPRARDRRCGRRSAWRTRGGRLEAR